MIYLATLYREGVRRAQASDVTAYTAVARLAAPKTGETVRVERIEKHEAGFMAGLIPADHPTLWTDERLCARLNESLDAAAETR